MKNLMIVTLQGMGNYGNRLQNYALTFVIKNNFGYEGFPTVTIEAKILNKPVLATDVSGIREQIVDGKHGIITENDEEAIYTSLKYLLDNKNLLVKLSCNTGLDNFFENTKKYLDFLRLIK